MKRYFIAAAVIAVGVMCASQKSAVMQEPLNGKVMLVGAVLIENDGIDDIYETKTANITAVIVGKYIESGKESAKGYRVKTDKNGYFMLANVPPGAYILKGIEADIGYASRFLVSSRWEGSRQVYFRESRMVDYTVRFWPPDAEGKVIDLKINYFRFDLSGRIYTDSFSSLTDKNLGLKDVNHTMANPQAYYKALYPASKWFE